MKRLMSRTVIETDTGCWVWQGYVGTHGYGAAKFKGRSYQVHRLSYWMSGNDLPDGSVVHHKCGVKLCINPAHLQAVTPAENVAESFALQAHARTIKELERKLNACTCGASCE
jgi:hypothetical protein